MKWFVAAFIFCLVTFCNGGVIDPVFEAYKNDEVQPEIQHHLVKMTTVCIPGSKYKIECNTCLCSSDGQSFTCTMIACYLGDINISDVEILKEDEDRISKEKSDDSALNVCKPRRTFFVGCNTCLCNIDGSNYSCTNKPCPLPDDVEIFHELRVLRSPAKSVVCAANRMFIKDCNTCWCNEDGTSYFCTRKVCVDDLPDEISETPIDLTLKRRARSASQQSAEAPHFEPLIKWKPKNCQPGQEFRLDCNQCLCDNEGYNFSCTRIDCSAQNRENNGAIRRRREVLTDCAPGSGSSQGCNNNEQDLNLPESDPTFRCNPGEQFQRNCNDCTCSADGRSFFCTIRLCDV